MVNAPASARYPVRLLRREDIERVVRIDQAVTGAARRRFMEKRLAAASAKPDDHLSFGVESRGELLGFALARVRYGEFGQLDPVVVLDAMGVDPGSRDHGIGHVLIAALQAASRQRGVRRIHTQAAWTSHNLLKFFDSAGFRLATRVVLERDTERPLANLPSRIDERHAMSDKRRVRIPERVGESPEVDYSETMPADYGPLARDRIPVRSLQRSDLAALVAIDRTTTGRDRAAYFERKLKEVLTESDVRISLVAELDGRPVGYIMARVNLGEFGCSDPTAEMDTLGVDPDYRGQGVARALISQLIANLGTLRVDAILTEVDWVNTALIAFLTQSGFRPSSRLALDCDLG